MVSLAALIPPPYEACPYCGADAFGVSSVFSDRLTRRCASCGRPGPGERSVAEPLPAIRKKVLYLDQFVVSNFALLVDPDADPQRVARAERWRPVYDRVNALVTVQALVCPSSGFHTNEALPRLASDSFMRSLDQVRLRLSGGLRFSEPLDIELDQLRHAVDVSTAPVPLSAPELVASSPFRSGDPHGWMPRLHVGVATVSMYAGLVDDVAMSLSGQGEALHAVFDTWRDQPPSVVRDQFELELASYGPSLLRALEKALERARVDPFAASSAAVVRYRALRRLLGDDDAATIDFLAGDAVKVMPKLRIASAMYAVLARQAANGMQAVEPSFAVDVAMTSTVMPYVEALLVDRRCAEVLRQPPARDEVARWGTTVLSAGALDVVIGWLDAVEAGVTDAHLGVVARVYGPSAVGEFRGVFNRPSQTAMRAVGT